VDKDKRTHAGRQFKAEEISLIKETSRMYPKLSQRELASTICELIGWVTPNGKPKRVQCSEFLRKLEAEGYIKLPALKVKNTRQERVKTAPGNRFPADKLTDVKEIVNCGVLKLEKVEPGKKLTQWREYMRDCHKLGDPMVPGSHIRYMIKSEDQDLGCMLFSGASWALAPREKWIGWTTEEKNKRLQLIINNSRFLILPWVQIKNLASRALSMAARRLQADWLEEYCYAPVLLETFVEPPYKGTCYKASNWIYIGETQGRGRNDRNNEWALTQKSIYVLPLQHDFRAVLKGEKPWKAAEPHV